MNTRLHTQSFNGGVVTPEFFGQVEDPRRQNGAARIRNFVPLPHGPAQSRAGTLFVREARSSEQPTRLLPFVFSVEQTFALEFGDRYVRFHTQGGTLLDGATPYEVGTPYAGSEVFGLRYVQSADVLTLVHPNHAPRELRRLGLLLWELRVIPFAPSMLPPTGVVATPNTAGPIAYHYVVTAVTADGVESQASAQATANNDLFVAGRFNTVTWASVAGAARYNVYRQAGGAGLFGQIGSAAGLSFTDTNITPDIGFTPPVYEQPFLDAGNFPSSVGYFDQRRVFAGTLNRPGNLWMTQTGTESVIAASIVPKDTDRIAFRIASRDLIAIQHIAPLVDLVLLTNSGEWRVTSVNSDAVTPTSISVRAQSYKGASTVTPALVNNTILFAAARGGHIHEAAFNWQASGYVTGNVCLRAPHLFDGLTIADMAFQRTPVPVLWAVSSNGELRSLTYVPEERVGAWATHDTHAGAFESVACVSEGTEDVLYAVVRRTVSGVPRRYIERFATRLLREGVDPVCVDSGLTYQGPAVTSLSGLSHLEGMEVGILANGDVHPRRTVSGGRITLDYPTSRAVVGLPITADIQTLPPIIRTRDLSAGQGRTYNINKAWMRLHRSGVVHAGQTESRLRPIKRRADAPDVDTGVEDILLGGAWSQDGQLWVRNADPLPVTVASVTLEMSVGG
ncbi:MAG TPA: hypothetical protein DCY89_05545 [Gammaproteobacteria bacterium]|nr:hypothetical protein [Gammaproteobacteria bacterium]